MNSVVEALTRLEKALGLEPTEVSEDIAALVTEREFSGTEFLAYLKAEYTKSKDLPQDQREVFKGYLGALIALAKMTYVSDGVTQAKIPTVTDYSPQAMVAWRAYQSRLASVGAGPGPGQTMSYKAAGGASPAVEPAAEPVIEALEASGDDQPLAKLSLADLRAAFDRMLGPALEAGIAKALTGAAAATGSAEPTAEPAEPVAEPETTDVGKAAGEPEGEAAPYEPAVSTIEADDGPIPRVRDCWDLSED